jgi:hypothetical protein
VRPHGIGLKDHADVALARVDQHPALRFRHHAAADGDAAAGGMFQPRHAAQCRGLAAARRAQQHHDLARRHVEIHAVDGGLARREALDEVLDEKRRTHWR